MANSFAANAFANNFITGYSFVDNIKRTNRAEARLEDRLAQEQADREEQRRRQRRGDRVQAEERAFQLSERSRLLSERDKQEQVFDLLNDPNVTVEELSEFSSIPEARQKIQEIQNRKRVSGALDTALGIGTAGARAPTGGGLSDQVTQTQATQAQTPSDPAARTAAAKTGADEFTFGAARGPSSLQQISEEEFNRSSKAYQQKNFFGKVGDVIVGQGSQTIRAVADAAKGVFTGGEALISTVADVDRMTNTQNVTDEFTGTVSVPADKYTSAEEFEVLQAKGVSQEELQSRVQANEAIATHYESEGRNPSNFNMAEPVPLSRQGAVLSTSDSVRRAAETIERKVVRRYIDFNDAQTDSHMNQLAVQNPKGAAALYLSDRATLFAADPTEAIKADRGMVSVLNEAEKDMQAQMARLDPNTAEAQQLQRSLSNLQTSRDIVAGEQPALSNQANINGRGLKQGDTERVNDVVDVIFDEQRPVATVQQPGSLKVSSSVASRIRPGQRLNQRQIQALGVLAEAGYMDKPTALGVMMNGGWPPGKDPAAIVDVMEAGGTVYAKHQNGTLSVLPASNKLPSREIADDQTKWFVEGAQTWGLDENATNQAIGMLSDYAPWIRAHYNVTSQESMRAAGRALGQSVFLSSKERVRMSNDGWWNFSDPEDAPSGEDIFLNPDMRNRLSEEYEVRPVPMPAVAERGELDFEPFRASIAEGAFEADLAAVADTLTQEQLKYIYWVQNATPEDIEAANAAEGR